MEDTQILPCPFCGFEPDEDLDRYPGYGGPSLLWVCCSCCEAKGPKCRTKEKAIEAWNTRDERKR